MPLFTGVRGETVWKSGIGPESELRRRPRGVEEPLTAANCGLSSAIETASALFQTVSEGEFSEVQLHVGGVPVLWWIETFVALCGMVGVQAMVLGRLGRKPSPHPRVCALSCPSPTIRGPGSLGHLTRPAVLAHNSQRYG